MYPLDLTGSQLQFVWHVGATDLNIHSFPHPWWWILEWTLPTKACLYLQKENLVHFSASRFEGLSYMTQPSPAPRTCH